jgi:hypothetical protein
VTAAELAARARDLPILVGSNAVEDYNALPRWSTTGSWASGSDVTAPAGPTRRVFDRRGTARSFPTLVPGAASYSLLFDLAEGTDAAHTIDTLAIWSDNFRALDADVTVYVDIANNSAFTTDLRTIAEFDIGARGDVERLVSTDLGPGGDERYTGVRWVRVRVTTTAVGGFTVVPEIGEVVLGRRRQCSAQPSTPYEEQGVEADVVDHESQSGASTRYVRWRGRRTFDIRWRLGGDGDAIGFETTLREFWRESGDGTKVFAWIESPIDAPYAVHFCAADPPVLSLPRQGPVERSSSFRFVEVAPFMRLEEGL